MNQPEANECDLPFSGSGRLPSSPAKEVVTRIAEHETGFAQDVTTAFTRLRPVENRKTENPLAATPVQRFVQVSRCLGGV